jgi:hypothetical protein
MSRERLGYATQPEDVKVLVDATVGTLIFQARVSQCLLYQHGLDLGVRRVDNYDGGYGA